MSIVDEGGGGGVTLSPLLIRVVGYVAVGLGVVAAIATGFQSGAAAVAIGLGAAIAPLLIMLPFAPLFEVTSRGQKGLNPLIGAPALAAMLVSLRADLVDYDQTWIWAAVGALAGLAAAFVTSQRGGLASPIQLTIAVAVTGALVGAAAFNVSDVELDASKAQLVPAAVQDKYESHGKSTSYHLVLSPWGPRLKPAEVTVSLGLYDAVDRGEDVCIWLHPGALGRPWYAVHLCPPAGPTP